MRTNCLTVFDINAEKTILDENDDMFKYMNNAFFQVTGLCKRCNIGYQCYRTNVTNLLNLKARIPMTFEFVPVVKLERTSREIAHRQVALWANRVADIDEYEIRFKNL